MKQIFLFLALLSPLIVNAYDAQIEGIYYTFDNNTKQATVTSGDTEYTTGNVTIPETVTYGNIKYKVTSIGFRAFRRCKKITSVIIGNNITNIDRYAFYECSGLTSISIGNSVESVDLWAFYGCTNLQSVHITGIKDWCKIDFKDSFSNPLCHAEHLFIDGKEIINLEIPDSVKSIGNFTFFNCVNITSVTIPSSVTSIGCMAFARCYNLAEIYCYSEEVPSIQSNTFRHSLIEYAILYVPETSVKAYKISSPWNKSRIIQPILGHTIHEFHK